MSAPNLLFLLAIVITLVVSSTGVHGFVAPTVVNSKSHGSRRVLLQMAGEGVELASKEDLQTAIANPDTVVLDIRSVEEIAATGYWKPGVTRWAHAPGSRQDNPLLSTAAKALVAEDPNTPVIVYCARGFRAEAAKEILEDQGFTNVMNAGGYPGDMEGIE